MAGNVELRSDNDNLEGGLNISPEVSSASEDTAGAILRALYRANATLAGILSLVGRNQDPSRIIEALDFGRQEVNRIVPKESNDNTLKASNDDYLSEEIKIRA